MLDDVLPVLAVLDERPALRRPASARALAELIAQERTKQDARMNALRRLRGDAAALLGDDDDRDAPSSVLSRVANVFRRRRALGEEELRARYEEAQLRARRAAAFAEALRALESELADEVQRLRGVLVELAHDEDTLDALLGRVRKAAADVEALKAAAVEDGARLHELDAALEKAKARADAVDRERAGVRDAEDRLLGLVEGERMLATRLAHLRAEVDAAARTATRALDDVADALRALVTAADSKRVVAELETALAKLVSSLDESARRAQSALDETK